jgi:hypothetical protein
MTLLFQSDRVFVPWFYSVSHRVLLLRSSRSEGAGTRIDILFPGVERMVVKAKYSGLRLSEATPIELEELEIKYGRSVVPAAVWLDDAKVDFIAPSNPQWHEDQGSDLDPSYFAPYLRLVGIVPDAPL